MSARFRIRIAFLLCVLALGLAGCASAGGSAAGGDRQGGYRSSNRIDATELTSMAELDVYQAITRLRPTWLRTSQGGHTPVVVLDGSPQTGGPDMLRSFRVADVTALAFMNASDATTRFGTGYAAGAILVTTRH